MNEAGIAELGVDPSIITQDPEVVSGVPVFAGTRLPVRILLNDLVEGASVDDFLRSYPSVCKEEAVNVLELAFERIIGPRDDENPPP